MDDVQCLMSAVLAIEVPHEPITGWHSKIKRHSNPNAKFPGHLDHSGWAIELRNSVLASEFLPNSSHISPGAFPGRLGLELLNICVPLDLPLH